MSSELSAPAFTFTVFTGTRNRAHTLPRVYESLKAQTFRDFEWLIIDNESTDGTPELIARWQAEADFPIRYIYHANRGQHGSANRGAQEARGELFLRFDSDDSCEPNALERLKHHWDSIPPDERHRFAGVTVLTNNERGEIHGTRFPFDPTDSDSIEIRYRYKVQGEKWGVLRTEIAREFPFPEIPGYVGLMPSSIVWNAIARRYKTRYVNEALKIWYQDQPTTLTKPVNYLDDAPGALIESRSMLNDDLKWFRYAPGTFFLKAAKYARSAFHAGTSAVGQFRELRSPGARLLWLAALPLGFVIYLAERLGIAHLLPGPRERSIARASSRGDSA
jgi:glycosyltransferase involved in cell wall biosynthesis